MALSSFSSLSAISEVSNRIAVRGNVKSSMRISNLKLAGSIDRCHAMHRQHARQPMMPQAPDQSKTLFLAVQRENRGSPVRPDQNGFSNQCLREIHQEERLDVPAVRNLARTLVEQCPYEKHHQDVPQTTSGPRR